MEFNGAIRPHCRIGLVTQLMLFTSVEISNTLQYCHFWCRYNFQVFPRDELRVGMPSFRFSCQSSYLTSMAREGFDFNACIYNGMRLQFFTTLFFTLCLFFLLYLFWILMCFIHLIGISYLSREQESAAKVQTGHLLLNRCILESASVYSVAVTIFMERIKTRVKNWVKSCADSNKTEGEKSVNSSYITFMFMFRVLMYYSFVS